ncbi:Ig-like domain-containing protein [Caloramator proteoclasticus]|uniref:Ig-like domain (Group 2) n=1 Tax=Caloramator proteoclasticus DSM 10124 TaxID=1121262 RepID=A0A1M4YEZ5_9CLOT|nr:Ig-like domain-containing protein [Caloramator proteoclasticus]SHF04357.1 Ig-like domain (group 2) [Caloramator proteoclasticus DSM 10124]
MVNKRRIVSIFIVFILLFVNFNGVLANVIDNSTDQTVKVLTVKKQPSSNSEIRILETKDKSKLENELKNRKKFTPVEYSSYRIEKYHKLLSNPYYELRNRQERYLETYVEFYNTSDKQIQNVNVIVDIGNEINSIYQFELEVYLANKDIQDYYIFVDEETGDRNLRVKIPVIQANQKYRLSIVQKIEIASPHFYDINVLKINPDYSNFSEYQRYISEEPKIETSYQPIIDKSHELLDSEKNVYDKILKAYEWVQFSMEYNYAYGNRGAQSAIDNLKGVCEDYSELLIALLRVQKIPARMVIGFRYYGGLPKDGTPNDVTYTYHAWVEVYYPNIGWIPMDPTVNPLPKYNNETGQWDKVIDLLEFIQDFPSESHIISDYNDVNMFSAYGDADFFSTLSNYTFGWTLSYKQTDEDKNVIQLPKFDLLVNNTNYKSIDLMAYYEGTKSLDYAKIYAYDAETNEIVNQINLNISGTNIKDYPIKLDNLLPNKNYKIYFEGGSSENDLFIKKTIEVSTTSLTFEDRIQLRPSIENITTFADGANFNIISDKNHLATKFKIEAYNLNWELEKTYEVLANTDSYTNNGVLNTSITGLKGSTFYTIYVTPYYYSYDGVLAEAQFMTNSEIKVTGVKLNITNKTVYKGENFNLTATITPRDAKNKGVTWSSSNSKVAVVDKYGRVTAVGAGTADIIVKTEDGGYTARCTVTVKQPIKVNGVKLNRTSLTLKKGSKYKLVATVLPTNATNKKVEWASSNLRVTKVDSNGNVIAVGRGTALITVRTNDGGYKRTCRVVVK